MTQLFHSDAKAQNADEIFIGRCRATVYNRAYLNNKEEHYVSQ